MSKRTAPRSLLASMRTASVRLLIVILAVICLTVSATTTPTLVLDLTYNYGTTSNNGNLLDATEKLGTWTRKQVYTYDALNRLDKTEENNGSTTTPLWVEDNAYDRFGNRWEVISGASPLTFNNKNRIVGYSYDSAGNMTNDTVRTYDYDAENRLKTVGTVANAFTYDGEGKRVRKDFPLGEQVRFVYGVGGKLIMEFNATTGALKKEYVYSAGGLLATIEPTGGLKLHDG
jgi:YD repeat-containing protein